eukprot:827073_1
MTFNEPDAMDTTANNAHDIDSTIWLSLHDQEKANKAIDVHFVHTSNKQQPNRIRSLHLDNIKLIYTCDNVYARIQRMLPHIWQEKSNQKSNIKKVYSNVE